MKLEFNVSISVGHGTGETSVEVDVTKKEYKLLKECYENGDEIEEFDGLENLCEKILEAVREESDDMDIDLSDISIEMPEEIEE